MLIIDKNDIIHDHKLEVKIFSHKMTLITFYVRNKKHLRERNNQKHNT